MPIIRIPFTKEDDELGAWLSAALEDPNVCKEFKEVINNWFNSKTITIKDISQSRKTIEKRMWESLKK